MFRLVKVQEPVRSDFVYKTIQVPHITYAVKPIVDKNGKILNKKEYYGSINVFTTEEKKTYPIENSEYFRIKADYVTMINAFREKEEDQFIGGMPVQMQKGCIKQIFRVNKFTNRLVYSVTLKVDGERFLMMVGLDSQVIFIDRSTNIFYLENARHERVRFPGIKAPFLLDGELVLHSNGHYEYLVFDILFYPNKANKLMTYMYENYENRYLVAHECVTDINRYTETSQFTGFHVSLKQWFPITEIFHTKDFYKYIADWTNDYRRKRGIPTLNADGLIFQPNDGPYIPFREWNGYNNVQFKWKPPEELTIDFKIKVIGNHWVLLTKTDQQFMVNQPKDSKGNNVQPVPAMCYPSKEDFAKYQDSDVVEFVYQKKDNPQKNLFQPVRLRNEKSANSYATIMSTLEVIYDPFYIDSLRTCYEIIGSDRISEKDSMKVFLNTVYNKSDLTLFAINKTNSSFFNPNEIKKIGDVYNTFANEPSNNYELEFRIFSYTSSEKVNMTKSTFFYLLDFCWQNFPMETYDSIDIVLNKYNKTKKFRSTYVNFNDIKNHNPIQNITKTSVKSFLSKPAKPTEKLYNNLTFKLDLSTEEHTDRKIGVVTQIDNEKVTNFIRVKSRKTFKVNDLWQIDLTRIKSSYFISDVLEKNETFECECEYIGPGSQQNNGIPIPFGDFLDSINKLYQIILSNSGYC
jgi:hypothetical protein